MADPPLRRWARLGALLAALLLSKVASAASDPPESAAPPAKQPASEARSRAPRTPLIVLHTAIADGADLRRPSAADGDLVPAAAALDTLLTDTAEDLGLTLDLTQRQPREPAVLSDRALLDEARALERTLLLPSLRALPGGGGEVEIRLALVEPSARALRVQSARVGRDDIAVRAVVLLRDLTGEGGVAAESPAPSPPAGALTSPARSTGRAALMISVSLFGGFFGYSIQRSSGADDPRLLYPLLAVGAGIGLGGAIIAAEEWEVGPGEAFYITAGEVWPSLAGHLIYAGRFGSRPPSDAWVFGLTFGTAGLTLSTLGLSLHGMSEGGAVLANSGGAFGLGLGALIEVFARGDLQKAPWAGMGYGASLGWLAAAAAAIRAEVAPSRLLFIDVGSLLGAIGGAALGSPLLLHAPDAARVRAWSGVTLGGALAGATVALLATRGAKAAGAGPGKKARALPVLPSVGVIGEVTDASRTREPILGVSLQGVLR